MDGAEVKRRRHALYLTQKAFGEKLGLSADFVGRLESNKAPVTPRTASAIRALKQEPSARKAHLSDPMERLIEQALIDAGIAFETDDGGFNESRLDFHLIDLNIEIEVKRFYSARTGEQMARARNVIVAQGERAIRFLAQAIRSGDFLLMIGDLTGYRIKLYKNGRELGSDGAASMSLQDSKRIAKRHLDLGNADRVEVVDANGALCFQWPRTVRAAQKGS